MFSSLRNGLFELPSAIGSLLQRTPESFRARAPLPESTLRPLTYEQRLSTGLPRPEDEFPRTTAPAPWLKRDPFELRTVLAQRLARVSLGLWQSQELRTAMAVLGTSALTVYGIGIAEASTV
eukprot:2271866-Prymnesium_polylepis.1